MFNGVGGLAGITAPIASEATDALLTPEPHRPTDSAAESPNT
jgi:hypothetical protein